MYKSKVFYLPRQKILAFYLVNSKKLSTFALAKRKDSNMVDVVQLVRASDCGSECRRFEPDPPPQKKVLLT